MKKLLPLIIASVLGSASFNVLATDLAEVFEQAKANDPELLEAKAKRDAAIAQIGVARAALLPSFNFEASHQRSGASKILREGYSSGFQVAFSQSIYDRKNWIGLDKAEMSVQLQNVLFEAEQQKTMFKTSQAYFDVLKAQDSLEFSRLEKVAISRQLEQVKQRFDVGLSAITDVNETQADYDTVLAREIQAENEVINKLEVLHEITGIQFKDLDKLDTAKFSASKPTVSLPALVKTATERNVGILAARIGKDLAKFDIETATAGHLPTLRLDGGYQQTLSKQPRSILNIEIPASKEKQKNLAATLKFVVPIYQGGAISANVEVQKANHIAASQLLEQAYRETIKNIRAVYNNINAAIGLIKAYEQSVVSANSALEATEAGFEVGTSTVVDVLNATQRLYDANRRLSEARYSYILNQLQLKQVIGELNEGDLKDINAGLTKG
ncbi:outer membrane channel protein TolC [Veronia pacifica]|uniref:Outer membrane channel protein TolC n=1 Tax=Veronia pacifica TaxID=1080227 RepID=A0A1C3EQ68_9GAMM|nr:outer membrane channel protein TolC [Veronia pacifica]ODA35384.1 outer membrane channel protein TolC [Veronia pacifica]